MLVLKVKAPGGPGVESGRWGEIADMTRLLLWLREFQVEAMPAEMISSIVEREVFYLSTWEWRGEWLEH